MNKISAVIVVKGNPSRFFDTIDSIKNLVSEICIVDIGIDQELKAKIKANPLFHLFEINKTIPYVELIREQTKQFATYNWVLFIDPDEVIPAGLENIFRKNSNRYDFFVIPRKNIIFGKWICHSRWWPDYQIRLFKKNAVRWPTVIHQQPTAQGKEYKIEAKEELAIIHYNYQTLDEYFEKMLRYAKAEAESLVTNRSPLTLTKTVNQSLSEFISRYFAQDGYKDGVHGFVLAFLQMVYYFVVYFYFWEKKKYPQENLSQTIISSQHFFQQGLTESNYWLIKKRLTTSIAAVKLKIINKIIQLFN